MLDHLTIPVSRKIGSKVIEKYKVMFSSIGVQETIRFGEEGKNLVVAFGDMVWVSEMSDDKLTPGTHFAFCVKTREDVDKWHVMSVKNGFKDNGGPGVRPQYGEHFYAAFVIDDIGNNLEVCCREPPSP